jgi:hypothetical protein
VYLDDFDPDAKDGPDLADYLRQKIGSCHGLMAVVSRKTIASWWVPWEIGVATERDLPMATFSHDSSDVPSYLRKWPYLTQLAQIDQYAQTAKRLIVAGTIHLREGAPTSVREALSGRAFNRSLRSVLGQ